MQEKVQELKQHLQEVSDLQAINSVLNWDQSTYMPPGGAAARGRHMALLGRLAQEKLTDPAVGELIEALEAADLEPDSDEAALVRVARHDFDQLVKVPADFLAQVYAHMSGSYQLWAKARENNDFASTIPALEKTLEYSRQLAGYFPGYDHIADPLIGFSDRGMKTESVRRVFAELREQLVPLVETITAQEPADDSCLHQPFPEDEQLAFGWQIAQKYGYDTERGRQDKTHHPFATKFSIGDVRITTRAKEDDLSEALFSTLHETGHALYEQGVNPDYEGTPLNSGTSAGVHESQSRLWENIVGRSRLFWGHYYPQLQQQFPEQLGDVSLDTFYRAINKVQRSLIRTDADEVTYNLHVMIRFDLEIDMLEGKLAVKDLAAAWHARYEQDLGLRAPSDVNGCLQDVHWFGGIIGGSFQGYTLGNIMSSMFYEQALAKHPEIPEQIGRGEFETLHGWLRENIYTHGRKYTADELIEKVTGGPLTIGPYMAYLKAKYGELYDLS